MSIILENLQKLKSEIDTNRTRIIAVSKYVGIEEIIQAYEVGIRNFGENKIQDAERKRSDLPENIDKDIIWHFVGHLQTNKVKKAVGNFEYIHSVDSLKLAELISEEAETKGVIQKVLIQVNFSKELTKSGFDEKEVEDAFNIIIKLNFINVQGLMTMALFTENQDVLHSTFRELRKLRDYLQEKYNYSLPELSMGMSNDYKIAAQEGATMIRIGQALFK